METLLLKENANKVEDKDKLLKEVNCEENKTEIY